MFNVFAVTRLFTKSFHFANCRHKKTVKHGHGLKCILIKKHKAIITRVIHRKYNEKLNKTLSECQKRYFF